MRNAGYEQALTKAGVEWKYHEKIPLEEINVTRGKQMQARLEPLDHSLIDQYENMFRDGLEPPALLVHKPGRGLYVPLDGNQRLAANAQCPINKGRRKFFDAYEIITDDPMIVDRMCWQFNNMVNGRRLSYDECMGHAVTMVRKYNQTQAQSAREWGVQPWQLSQIIQEQEMRELAQSKNVTLPPAMPDGAIVTLGALRDVGDDVAVKAMKAAAENGLGTSHCQELLKEVKKAKTSKDKIQAIDEYVKQEKIVRNRAETKGGRVRHNPNRLPRMQLQKLIEQIDSLLGEYDDGKAVKPVGKDDQEEFYERSLRVCNRLIQIYGLGTLLRGKEGVA